MTGPASPTTTSVGGRLVHCARKTGSLRDTPAWGFCLFALALFMAAELSGRPFARNHLEP